jgi:hypothetical protein
MGLQEELAKMAEWMEQDKCENGEIVACDKLNFPVEVSAIEILSDRQRRDAAKVGALVRVRPCAKDCGDKTYLGIFLGDLPLEVDAFYRDKSHKLTIGLHRNPAMFVPELKRVVWGCGSWWGFIEKPEDAERMITGESIASIPYVKVLKAMIEAEKVTPGEP